MIGRPVPWRLACRGVRLAEGALARPHPRDVNEDASAAYRSADLIAGEMATGQEPARLTIDGNHPILGEVSTAFTSAAADQV